MPRKLGLFDLLLYQESSKSLQGASFHQNFYENPSHFDGKGFSPEIYGKPYVQKGNIWDIWFPRILDFPKKLGLFHPILLGLK
jgi:hypothetical protein